MFPRNVTEFSYRYHESSRADMMVSFQTLAGTTRREKSCFLRPVLGVAAGSGSFLPLLMPVVFFRASANIAGPVSPGVAQGFRP